jgi:hypothetical protein
MRSFLYNFLFKFRVLLDSFVPALKINLSSGEYFPVELSYKQTEIGFSVGHTGRLDHVFVTQQQ